LNRFTKGNARRFYRYNTEVKFFIVPKQPTSTTELFHIGIDYFNRATHDQIQHLRSQVVTQLRLIHSHQTILKKIVQDVFLRFDLVITYLEAINAGTDPKKKRSYWQERQEINQPFAAIEMLQQHAPRTYDMLKRLERKFLTYIEFILETIDKSSATRLYFPKQPEVTYFEPEILNHLQNKNIDHTQNNLLTMIVELEQLLAKGIEPYTNMASDLLLGKEHAQWQVHPINLSACGLAIEDTRKYTLLDNVTIRIITDEKNLQVLEFDGKVMRNEYKSRKKLNLSAMDFYFPDPNYQHNLLSFLQRLETDRAMEAFRNYAWY